MNLSNPEYKMFFYKVHKYFESFIDFPVEDFMLLMPYAVMRKFPKKAIILQAGEIENHLNFVVKGLVRKYMLVKNKQVTTQLAIEGQIIHAEISFHKRIPAEVYIDALEPCELLSISFDNLEQVYKQYPKTEKLGRLIVTDMFIKKDFRDFEKLEKTTREYFLEYVKTHPHMLQRVPQKILASYLNIKPETFSRLKHLVRG